MSLWWFDQLADLVPHHVVSTDVPDEFRGRAVVCERLEMFPVECVARGYLTGSGLLEYRAHRRGLRDRRCPTGSTTAAASRSRSSPRPPRPPSATTTRTSPTTRSSRTVGAEAAAELRRLTLAVYGRAEGIARERGIILADTKLEFGRRAGRHHRARRRGADAGLLPVLAGRRVAAGPGPAVVRQADRAQLAALAGVRLGPGRRALRRRRCRPRSSSAPASGTSRPTSCSPGSRSDHRRVHRPGGHRRIRRRRCSATSPTRATAPSGSRRCCR